ncbi:ArsR/SmtB family transcription factor [Bifidobacterium panos]|uniref:Transcriptional regulator n=1 Tax=Bifidobacterium panos TaxID=2675321 RepID=A0ABX1SU71_9BIFI|nr:metalloregulator ArsR/SmtB family transcription factor [Bifidobacterium sp. DSM 109963]NMN01384.1 transcriptional regulator [Bifidobacterium sp. DSM 109963]
MDHAVTPFCEEVRKLEEEFKNCQKLLTAVGDENRQHLLCVMLNCPIEGARVTQIAEMTHLSRPAVSHHMQILKAAGLVKSRKEGTYVYYYLDPDDNQVTLLASLVERMAKVMAQLPDRR